MLVRADSRRHAVSRRRIAADGRRRLPAAGRNDARPERDDAGDQDDEDQAAPDDETRGPIVLRLLTTLPSPSAGTQRPGRG
jgi:hypothetical protein